jgi:hypothetical protein
MRLGGGEHAGDGGARRRGYRRRLGMGSWPQFWTWFEPMRSSDNDEANQGHGEVVQATARVSRSVGRLGSARPGQLRRVGIGAMGL